MSKRLLACAGMAFLGAAAFWAGGASAQNIVVTPTTARASHIGVQPYMRIPVGSRSEAAQLKAEQDAAKLAAQPKKGGKPR